MSRAQGNRGALLRLSENPDRIRRQSYAFLPAALEIQETPPSPTGRAIIWTILVLFAAAVAWALVGKVDIVAVAHGKVIPSGRVKQIQPLEIGVVQAIHVREGEQVTRGQPLITLDPTGTEADLRRLQQDQTAAQLRLARIRLFQQFLEGAHGKGEAEAPSAAALRDRFSDQADEAAIRTQQRLFDEQVNDYRSRRQSLQSQLDKRKAERERAQAMVTKLERTLPLVAERAASLQKLLGKDMVSRDQYLELEERRIEQQQDLAALRAEHRQLGAAIEEIQHQLQTLDAETQKANLDKLSETSEQLAQIHQELIKARRRNDRQTLRSPIDGTVHQLAVHTVGGVVTPAQELMLIVPRQSTLEVEAKVLNKDIGFVDEGQTAEVKVDTFNFTKYGTLDAEITDLSHDAVSDEDLGLVYLSRVRLRQTQLPVNGKLVNLSPGMGVTVEIKTGKRRLIEFFLSPLMKYRQESIRER